MKESQIVTACKTWLATMQKQKKLRYVRNNSGAAQIDYPGRKPHFIRFGSEGTSDFIILLPKGITLFCEVKKDAFSKLNPAQIEFKDDCARLGHPYLVIFSLDDLMTNLESKYGIK